MAILDLARAAQLRVEIVHALLQTEHCLRNLKSKLESDNFKTAASTESRLHSAHSDLDYRITLFLTLSIEIAVEKSGSSRRSESASSEIGRGKRVGVEIADSRGHRRVGGKKHKHKSPVVAVLKVAPSLNWWLAKAKFLKRSVSQRFAAHSKNRKNQTGSQRENSHPPTCFDFSSKKVRSTWDIKSGRVFVLFFAKISANV